jgi:hypothetical protein
MKARIVKDMKCVGGFKLDESNPNVVGFKEYLHSEMRAAGFTEQDVAVKVRFEMDSAFDQTQAQNAASDVMLGVTVGK